MPFHDRQHAGRELARPLERYRGEDPLVLGLARGGVPVAYEVAVALDAELDAMVARKLGAPDNPEFGIGAIAPGGARVLNEDVVNALGISRSEIDEVEARERVEMERRLLEFRGERAMPRVAGRTVVLVDDGIATGSTALAAVRAVRDAGARRVVLAVPVCAAESAEAFEDEVDEVVCLETPEPFRAVGLWYEDFAQTSDEEVRDLLARARRGASARAAAGRGP